MPVVPVEPQHMVLETFLEGLADLTGSQPRADSALHHVPVYALELDALAQGQGIESQKFSGCRFYVTCPDPIGIVACGMTAPGDYGKAKFRNLLSGALAVWGWAAIPQLKTALASSQPEYELCLLVSPPLFVEAFYLRATADGVPSLVAPLDLFAAAPGAPVLQEVGPYLASLQPLIAERAIAVSDPMMA